MKKLMTLFAILLFAGTTSFYSCGGGKAANTPGETLKKSMSLLADKKYDDVVAMYAKKDGTTLTDEEKKKMSGLMSLATGELDKKQGVKSIDILEEKIADDGKTATVKFKTTYGNGETNEETNDMVNIDGKWFITIGN
jgi:hypothetical protein